MPKPYRFFQIDEERQAVYLPRPDHDLTAGFWLAWDQLTDRDKEVIRLLSAGFTYRDIADRLGRGLTSVYRQVASFRRKFKREIKKQRKG